VGWSEEELERCLVFILGNTADVLSFAYEMSPTGSRVEHLVLVGGAILGGGWNFRVWDLAGGSRSLGCAFKGYTWSLVLSSLFLPVCHEVKKLL
jgi:hypothetical protein